MINNDGVRLPPMTWPKIAILCATMVGSALAGVVGIGHFWLDSMDRHISALDDKFERVMQQNAALQGAFGGTRADLIKEISETREIVAVNSTKLDAIKGEVGSLQSQIGEVRTQYQSINEILLKAPWRPQ